MNRRFLLNAFRSLATLAVAIAVIRIAWISDDALITLRSALNTTHGWGLGFNATESVQAYTHPLWFLLWSLIGGLTNQWIVGILILSVVLTVASAAFVFWQIESFSRLAVVAAGLILSNAFIEYSTSGLENSLGYFSIAIIFLISLRWVTGAKPRPSAALALLFGLSLGAAFLTRMDYAVLLLPPVLVVMWTQRSQWKNLLIGAIGLIAPTTTWFFWSYTNFSAFLPNTFEAKRNVEIPQSELFSQGLQFFVVSFRFDLISFFMILAAILVTLWRGSSLQKSWVVGMLLYSVYVASFGGDFMAGRYIAILVFVSALLLATAPVLHSQTMLGVTAFAILVSILVSGLPVSLVNPQSERWQYADFSGIADERGFYLSEANRSISDLFTPSDEPYSLEGFIPPVGAEFAKSGLRDINRLANSWPQGNGRINIPADVAIVCGLTGSWGIVTGPTVHLIDACGLTDRFIAQQPFVPGDVWRPGHFERPLPEGYEQAIRLADPQQLISVEQQEQLRELWLSIRK